MNAYSPNHIFADAAQAAIFYANQAKNVEDDPKMAEIYQVSCETAELLLKLHSLEQERK